jgi:hypothetical protein
MVACHYAELISGQARRRIPVDESRAMRVKGGWKHDARPEVGRRKTGASAGLRGICGIRVGQDVGVLPEGSPENSTPASHDRTSFDANSQIYSRIVDRARRRKSCWLSRGGISARWQGLPSTCARGAWHEKNSADARFNADDIILPSSAVKESTLLQGLARTTRTSTTWACQSAEAVEKVDDYTVRIPRK